MTIKELFIRSNETEQEVITHISDSQWDLAMPAKVTREPMTLEKVVRYHTWDSAWIPDGLAGKTLQEVGDTHRHLLDLKRAELKSSFITFNQRAIAAVRDLADLNRVVHLSYGDFPARQFLQHNIGVRAFWSYDIARLIGFNLSMTDELVQALADEFSPVVETYRSMGLFPPEIKAARHASPLARLMAMAGRE